MVIDDSIDPETKAFLTRIRKTIEDSSRMIDEVGLRMRETDRMLERQGLTREQVMSMRFSEAQIEAAKAEMKRRGMDPFEIWSQGDGGGEEDEDPFGEPQTFKASDLQAGAIPTVPGGGGNLDVDERQKKFGMMMKPFRI